jgi:hypothetical protein
MFTYFLVEGLKTTAALAATGFVLGASWTIGKYAARKAVIATMKDDPEAADMKGDIDPSVKASVQQAGNVVAGVFKEFADAVRGSMRSRDDDDDGPQVKAADVG